MEVLHGWPIWPMDYWVGTFIAFLESPENPSVIFYVWDLYNSHSVWPYTNNISFLQSLHSGQVPGLLLDLSIIHINSPDGEVGREKWRHPKWRMDVEISPSSSSRARPVPCHALFLFLTSVLCLDLAASNANPLECRYNVKYCLGSDFMWLMVESKNSPGTWLECNHVKFIDPITP